MTSFQISNTAQQKMAKLHLSVNEINLALNKGTKIHRTGAVFFFLGKKDLPEGSSFERLNGLTVIVKDRKILTVYRNKKVLPVIKQKAKRNNWKKFVGYGKPSFLQCPYHHAFEFCECIPDMGIAA